MKKATNKARQRQMTRREFVGGALATAGIVTGAPALLRGQNLNDKLNIAFIGSGGRASASLRELTIVPERDKGRTGGRGGTPDPAAGPHPDENVTVLCDINNNAIETASTWFPKAKRVNDLRKVFDNLKDFDAVVVSTTEHTHAFATYLALIHGKHVYCEKPLTYNVWEARLI